MTSAENALGIASQPFTTASPRAQMDRSLFSRTRASFDRLRIGRGAGSSDAGCLDAARQYKPRAAGGPEARAGKRLAGVAGPQGD
jgi:hypothetical protein